MEHNYCEWSVVTSFEAVIIVCIKINVTLLSERRSNILRGILSTFSILTAVVEHRFAKEDRKIAKQIVLKKGTTLFL